MEGLERFRSSLLNSAKKYILDKVDPTDPELGEVVMNLLFSSKGPTQISRDLSEVEIVFGKIFYGFFEIVESFDRLKNIEIYIRRFPYQNTSITKLRNLSYHFENHFNEVYILKERLLVYLTKLGRVFKGKSNHSNVLKITRPIFGMIKKSFDGIVSVRGSHVHVNRYKDRDLDKLSILELLALNTDEDFFKNYYKLEYKNIRKKKSNHVKTINDQIKSFLDYYLDSIYYVVFDKNGELLYEKI